MKKKIRIIGLLLMFSVAATIYMYFFGPFEKIIRTAFEKSIFNDKGLHIILFGLITYGFNLLLWNKTIRSFGKIVNLALVLMLVYVIIDEVIQYFKPDRTFDLLDLLCSFIGVFLFGYLSIKTVNWLQSKEDAQTI